MLTSSGIEDIEFSSSDIIPNCGAMLAINLTANLYNSEEKH